MAKKVNAFLGFNNKLFINETDADVDIEKNISKQIENIVIKSINEIFKDKTNSVINEKSIISNFIINYRPEILKIYNIMDKKHIELSNRYKNESLLDDSLEGFDETFDEELDETLDISEKLINYGRVNKK